MTQIHFSFLCPTFIRRCQCPTFIQIHSFFSRQISVNPERHQKPFQLFFREKTHRALPFFRNHQMMLFGTMNFYLIVTAMIRLSISAFALRMVIPQYYLKFCSVLPSKLLPRASFPFSIAFLLKNVSTSWYGIALFSAHLSETFSDLYKLLLGDYLTFFGKIGESRSRYLQKIRHLSQY